MPWSRLILIAALLYGGYLLKPRLFGGGAPRSSYADLDGNAHSFGPGKPAAMGYWFEGCPESEAVISVLNELSQKHPPEKLHVVSFYVNVAEDAAIAGYARDEGVLVPVVPAQKTPERFAELNQAFPVQGATVYVMDKVGSIHKVEIAESGTEAAVQEAEKHLN